MVDDKKLRMMLLQSALTIDATALGQFLPYYQHQHPEWLTEEQRFYFFRALHGWMKNDVERKHFKQTQTRQTLKDDEDVSIYHYDRILIFIEHLPKYTPYWRYNTSIILKTFQREFPYYEAILQYRRLGISLTGITNARGRTLDVWDISRHWIVRQFVKMCAWQRSRYKLYEDWYYYRYGKDLTDTQLVRVIKRMEHIDNMIRQSCGAFHYKMMHYTELSADLVKIEEQNLERMMVTDIIDPYENIKWD